MAKFEFVEKFAAAGIKLPERKTNGSAGYETPPCCMEKYSSGEEAPLLRVQVGFPGARVQISPSPPKKSSPNGLLFFLAEGEICRSCATACKASGAQITEQSRVGKLACQRGGEGCSRGGSSKTSGVRKHQECASALAPQGSRVQIYAFFSIPIQTGLRFLCFYDIIKKKGGAICILIF